jgi:heme oxygenase
MTAVMTRLRVETRELHQAAERTFVARAIMGGTLTRAGYAAHLAGLCALHESLEFALDRSKDARVQAVWNPSMRRAPRLALDLRALRVAPAASHPGEAEARLAAASFLDEREPAALLGALYVFEGSSLGARVLLPLLEASLGLGPEATGYYRGEGARAGERFRAFSDRMNQALADGDGDAAVRGAREAFLAVCALYDAVGRAAPGSQATLELSRVG